MTAARHFMTLTILALAVALAGPAGCATSTRSVSAPAVPAVAPAPPPAPPVPSAAAPRPPAPAPLLGHVTREQLRNYASWEPLFAQPYLPDPGVIAAIKANANGVTVLLIMATWCPDSKRELPRFFAIMDGVGMDEAKLTMVGVDRTKIDAEGLTAKWSVTRVPTFVFLRNGQEVGRVVERTPAGATLEGEIARLLATRVDK